MSRQIPTKRSSKGIAKKAASQADECVVLDGSENEPPASSTPLGKRRGRKPSESCEGQKDKGIGKKGELFQLTFRPTRNPTCSKLDILKLLIDMSRELIISQIHNLTSGAIKCPREFVIYIRLKQNTAEMMDYNSRCRTQDTKQTFKKHPNEWITIFNQLNQWPDDIPIDQVSQLV